jgi:hypothetical protein
VSKAIREVAEEKLRGDEARALLAQRRVNCFTNQLNESNPILTEISDAMTEEGRCQTQIDEASLAGDVIACQTWQARLEIAGQKKNEWNAKLKECSAHYETMMRLIREESEQAITAEKIFR